MENAIVKINPADYGLNETKAKEIESMFNSMLAKMVELEKEFNEIAKLEINPETCEKARDLRLRYVKVRTGTAEIHRELKAFYLNGGRFVDGWKNAQLFASQGMEEKLTAIEKHFEIIEAERISKLQEKRAGELTKYEVEYIPDNLGLMPENVWSNFLLGTKTNYEARKEAERKAEEERQENIRLDKRERERRERALPYIDYWQGIVDANVLRDLSDEVFEGAFEKIITAKKEDDKKKEQIRKENIRLQKEAEERERQAKIEAEQRAKAEAERMKKEEAEREAREEKERKDREANEAALRKEREAKERVEAELRAKEEAEEKARILAEAKQRAEDEARKESEKQAHLAPDKKKLEILTEDILRIILNSIPEVKNSEALKITQEVKIRLEEIRQYIFNQSKSL